jgi:hypothetical protein
MAVQFDATMTKPCLRGKLCSSELGHCGRLIRRRVALLVGHDQKNVRSGHRDIVHERARNRITLAG